MISKNRYSLFAVMLLLTLSILAASLGPINAAEEPANHVIYLNSINNLTNYTSIMDLNEEIGGRDKNGLYDTNRHYSYPLYSFFLNRTINVGDTIDVILPSLENNLKVYSDEEYYANYPWVLEDKSVNLTSKDTFMKNNKLYTAYHYVVTGKHMFRGHPINCMNFQYCVTNKKDFTPQGDPQTKLIIAYGFD